MAVGGRLIGIARRAAQRAPMEVLDHVLIGPGFGLQGDYRGKVHRGKLPKRQVSILSLEAWEEACAEVGRAIPWTVRRANLLVSGLMLPRWPGDIIAVGPARLEVMVECDPCIRMDEQVMGLDKALRPDWRGGVLCRVLSGGDVGLGDPVCIEEGLRLEVISGVPAVLRDGISPSSMPPQHER